MSLIASRHLRFAFAGLLVAVVGVVVFVFAPRSEVVLYREVSKFQTLVVVEQGDRRCLRFGDGPQALNQTCRSSFHPHRVELDYARAIVALALSLEPAPKRVLVIGLGGGSIPTALIDAHPDLELDAVELDPAVVTVAANYFDFHTAKSVHVFAEDGVAFVARAAQAQERYDLVVLDAFDDTGMPDVFTTAQFVSQLEAIGGVVLVNSFGAQSAKAYESFKAIEIGRNRLLLKGRVNVPREASAALDRIGADDAWLREHFH